MAAGREFVEGYALCTHYTEGLHGIIKGGAKHYDHNIKEMEYWKSHISGHPISDAAIIKYNIMHWLL